MTALVQRGVLPTLEAPDDTGKAVIVNPAGDNYVLGAAQSGATDLSAYEGPAVSITTTAGLLKLVGHTDSVAGVWITDEAADGGSYNGIYWANNDEVDGAQSFQVVTGASVATLTADANGVGFNGMNPSIPVIPATPTEQDIADVLVALGLATQAGA